VVPDRGIPNTKTGLELPVVARGISFKADLEKHLITLNWAAFAEGYNGSQYAQNKYAVKLKKAFDKYDKK